MSREGGGRAGRGAGRRLLWFVGLWAAGVLGVAAVAAVIRWAVIRWAALPLPPHGGGGG